MKLVYLGRLSVIPQLEVPGLDVQVHCKHLSRLGTLPLPPRRPHRCTETTHVTFFQLCPGELCLFAAVKGGTRALGENISRLATKHQTIGAVSQKFIGEGWGGMPSRLPTTSSAALLCSAPKPPPTLPVLAAAAGMPPTAPASLSRSLPCMRGAEGSISSAACCARCELWLRCWSRGASFSIGLGDESWAAGEASGEPGSEPGSRVSGG